MKPKLDRICDFMEKHNAEGLCKTMYLRLKMEVEDEPWFEREQIVFYEMDWDVNYTAMDLQ